MADRLDIELLQAGFTAVKIGVLSKDVIGILGLNRNECDIILWEDRFKYIEKHKLDFRSEDDFYKHIALIPDIIKNPDYIGKHPSKNSIEYIKRIDDIMLVAIRIRDTGNLAFRSAYPITEKQLSDYINSKTIVKLAGEIDKTE